MSLSTSDALSLTQRRAIQYCTCNWVQDVAFRHRITEREETSKFWPGPLIPSRTYKPAWLLGMQTWGWRRGAVFPSLISPGHTQATEQRHLPAELRSCGCFSGVCLQSVSQGGSLERKGPLCPATAFARSPLSPCPRSHSVFCRWSSSIQSWDRWGDVADTPRSPWQSTPVSAAMQSGSGYWQVQRWDRLINVAGGRGEAPSMSCQRRRAGVCFPSIRPEWPSVQLPEHPGCGPEGGGLIPHLWPIGTLWFPSQ